MKKGVLKNFTKFTGKHLCQFPVNFVKFLGTPFLQNTSGRLLLVINNLKGMKLFSDQMNRSRSNPTLARRVWNCSTMKNLRCLISAANKIIQ